jgi:hypothetical protein
MRGLDVKLTDKHKAHLSGFLFPNWPSTVDSQAWRYSTIRAETEKEKVKPFCS